MVWKILQIMPAAPGKVLMASFVVRAGGQPEQTNEYYPLIGYALQVHEDGNTQVVGLALTAEGPKTPWELYGAEEVAILYINEDEIDRYEEERKANNAEVKLARKRAWN